MLTIHHYNERYEAKQEQQRPVAEKIQQKKFHEEIKTFLCGVLMYVK